MALINCPDCKKEVSENAPACPNCGAPIAVREEDKDAGAPLTTVQETSKKFKKLLLASAFLFWGGLASGVWIFEDYEVSPVPGFMILSGLVLYVATKFSIWWHHK